VLSRSRQFSTSAEVSERHFGTGAELSGHFGTSLIVLKCLGSEVSWVRSVFTPHRPTGRATGQSGQWCVRIGVRFSFMWVAIFPILKLGSMPTPYSIVALFTVAWSCYCAIVGLTKLSPVIQTQIFHQNKNQTWRCSVKWWWHDTAIKEIDGYDAISHNISLYDMIQSASASTYVRTICCQLQTQLYTDAP